MLSPDGTPFRSAGVSGQTRTSDRCGVVNLREERLRRGKPIREMAAEIGVTPRVLHSAEQGTRPRPANALKIATAYGFDVVAQWPEPQEEAAAA
jgi:transcriptional regulator with XRE-family HTH domain